MESVETDDLIYQEMSKFDFTKPFMVSVTVEEMHQNGFQGNITSLRNGTETFNLDGRNQKSYDYVQNQNITQSNTDNIYNVIRSTSFNINTVHSSPRNSLESNPSTTMPHQTSELSFTNNHNSISSAPVFGGIPSSYSGTIAFSNKDFNVTTPSLNTVSKSIIRILQACNYFLSVIQQSGTSSSRICNAKTKYINVKTHYYKLCQGIVLQEILPQRYNQYFVRAFLDKTRNMALNEDKFSCSYKQIEYIFNELLKWSKFSNGNNRAPLHTELISQPSTLTFNGASQSNTQSSQVVSKEWNYNMDQREKPPDQVLLPDRTNCRYAYSNPDHESSNASTKVLYVNGHNNTAQMNANRNRYNTDLYVYKKQSADLNTNQISYQDDTNAQYYPRRSISRDSGVMSPGNDLFIDLCSDYQNQESALPSTSHLVPRNAYEIPAVAEVCLICGVEATVSCVGCIGFYYCGPMCQALDWSKHKDICGSKQS